MMIRFRIPITTMVLSGLFMNFLLCGYYAGAQPSSYQPLSYRGLALGKATEQEVLSNLGKPKEEYNLIKGGKEWIIPAADPQVKEILARFNLDDMGQFRLDSLYLTFAQPPKLQDVRAWYGLTVPADEGDVQYEGKSCYGEYYIQGLIALISCENRQYVTAVRYLSRRSFAEYLSMIPFRDSQPEFAAKKAEYLKLADKISSGPPTPPNSSPDFSYKIQFFDVLDETNEETRITTRFSKEFYPGEPAIWQVEDKTNLPAHPGVWKVLTFTLESPNQGTIRYSKKISYRHQDLRTSKIYSFQIPKTLAQGEYEAVLKVDFWRQGAHRPFFSTKKNLSLTVR